MPPNERVEADASGEMRPAESGSPAVGIVAGEGDDLGAVARALLAAFRHGYDILFTHTTAAPAESVELAHAFDATVIPPAGQHRTGESLRHRLSVVAQERGYPGLVLYRDPGTPVDLPRSAEQVRAHDGYAVDAVPAAPDAEGTGGCVVAIPAYDEVDSIAAVVRAAREHADQVLVVDDGSTDGTAGAAREAGAIVIEHDGNRGYGAALKSAFVEADRLDADELVVIDGDGQHDPADIPRLRAPLDEDGVEVVIGNRFGGDGDVPTYRRVGIGVVNLLTNLGFGGVLPGQWVEDTQSGFRAYGRPAIESLAADDAISEGMDASVDILHHVSAHGYGIEEVGTSVDYDVDEPSTHHPVRHGLRVVSNVLRTVEHEHPILILGVPGFVSVLVGSGFTYWTVANYLGTTTFPFGLALVSVALLLGGILSSFTGIILHAVNQIDA